MSSSQIVLRANQKNSVSSSANSFVCHYDRPPCVLEKGDTVQLFAVSIDNGISDKNDSIHLHEDVDITFEFVPGIQHTQSDASEFVYQAVGKAVQSYDAAGNPIYSKNLDYCPNGGFAYPLDNKVDSTGKILTSSMKRHTKTINISSGTYTKSQMLQVLNDKLNDFNSNFDENTMTYTDSSFLQTTENLENNNSFKVVNGQVVLQDTSNEHTNFFFHPEQGDWHTELAGPNSTQIQGRVYGFARRTYALDRDNNLETTKLEPIYFGASTVGFFYVQDKLAFSMHTPYYDTTALTSDPSSAEAIVAWKNYGNTPLLRKYDTTQNEVLTVEANFNHLALRASVFPRLMGFNRYGAMVLTSVKETYTSSNTASDLFSQLGIDMQKHCISTSTKEYRLEEDNTITWRVEVPDSIEDGIFTSSEMGNLEQAMITTDSHLYKPFYYDRTTSNGSERYTDRTHFLVVGNDDEDYIDENGNSIGITIKESETIPNNEVDIRDFAPKFSKVSSGIKYIMLSKSEEETTQNPPSYDISVDFFNASNISMSTTTSSALFFAGIVGNYNSSQQFTSGTTDDFLSITYNGPTIPLSSIKVTINDSSTESAPQTLGKNSLLTFVVRKAVSRF